ncbi:GCN5-related N-acetyltransferase [Streptomyces venezuelae]|uniref:GNAT family N-acetyltransferase n=1 Tax=Streptomyces gardneri TaxID=66892 RepID=UPI0006BC410F|nr:GNAT family N-acetyltransferase [Streptomyces gardneri]ALO11983.1 GCN5-related N-acetyltransferase [Streptomyces venezuelae]QPK48830.1 GNAT family N-acetyltransferase [Streptomyces gardneri]WRK40313.1 GNAT family N-acetyltransferase [Streptomyces venezuelae]CUM37447.1 GCN5-related N-acetyltransferase [Streptomyces venezuelae]
MTTSSGTTTSIREATPEDAAALAGVHVRSWQAAYRDLLPGPYLDSLDPEERAAVWHDRLTAPDRPTVLLATEADGRVVAFSCLRAWPGEEPEESGASHASDGTDGTDGTDALDLTTTAELAALYALPEAWGTGVGRSLLAASTEVLVTAGFRTAVLWVFADNTRGRRFYEAAGWRPDGRAVRDVTGGRELEELRYRRELFD